MSRGQRHPAPRRLDDGRVLVTRAIVAHLAHRHVNHVRQAVPAVACDVPTRAALLDLDQAETVLAAAAHRRVRRPLSAPGEKISA